MNDAASLKTWETLTIPMPLRGTLHLDLPADLQFLTVLEGCLRALLGQEAGLSDPEARTFEVILAVHETCSNVIEHAYGGGPGRIKLAFSFLDGPRRLVVEIHDTGKSFTLPAIQQPNLHEVQTSGYGLFLIHRLMDEVRYQPEPGNNRWTLVKRLG